MIKSEAFHHEKFIVKGGHIKSTNDGDIHFIKAEDVANLYGIKRNNWKSDTMGVNYPWIILRPDETGEYNLAHQVSKQIREKWQVIERNNTIKECKSILLKSVDQTKECKSMSILSKIKLYFTKQKGN